MLTRDEIKTRVIEAISEVINQELSHDLPLSTNIYSDLRMDSMDLASLVMLLEDDYDVQIDESSLESVTTLEQVVNLLYELQEK